MNVRALFEKELQRRGISFSVDAESGRHELNLESGQSLVSLENLRRDLESDGDEGRVGRFVDSIVARGPRSASDYSAEGLYWSLEPSDYETKADYCVSVSKQSDRVLVHLSQCAGVITWVNEVVLNYLGMTRMEAEDKAAANLGSALSEATVEFSEINGVRLGYIGTSLPFKASFILAPNLQKVVGEVLGWPLLAVAPNRDFLYLWAARHEGFAKQVGGVVIEQFTQASYPISTEVYEISETGIRAVGAFPRPA